MEELKEYIPWKSKDAKSVLVHPNLLEELKKRKETIELETGEVTEGGITAFSAMAALELKLLRESSDKIIRESLKLNRVKINKFNINGRDEDFVPYEVYKELILYLSVLRVKKDQNPIKIEINKLRGLKKNEIRYFW